MSSQTPIRLLPRKYWLSWTVHGLICAFFVALYARFGGVWLAYVAGYLAYLWIATRAFPRLFPELKE